MLMLLPFIEGSDPAVWWKTTVAAGSTNIGIGRTDDIIVLMLNVDVDVGAAVDVDDVDVDADVVGLINLIFLQNNNVP